MTPESALAAREKVDRGAFEAPKSIVQDPETSSTGPVTEVARVVAIVANAVVGLAPSLLLFADVERRVVTAGSVFFAIAALNIVTLTVRHVNRWIRWTALVINVAIAIPVAARVLRFEMNATFWVGLGLSTFFIVNAAAIILRGRSLKRMTAASPSVRPLAA
jgi:hypothetical protein